jgi:hypothetical protein
MRCGQNGVDARRCCGHYVCIGGGWRGRDAGDETMTRTEARRIAKQARGAATCAGRLNQITLNHTLMDLVEHAGFKAPATGYAPFDGSDLRSVDALARCIMRLSDAR